MDKEQFNEILYEIITRLDNINYWLDELNEDDFTFNQQEKIEDLIVYIENLIDEVKSRRY